MDHGGVVRRHELTDQEWELLAPLIPRAATGRPRVSDRQVIDGMVHKTRTGISWRDLPERYGPWQTVCTDLGLVRFARRGGHEGGQRRRRVVQRNHETRNASGKEAPARRPSGPFRWATRHNTGRRHSSIGRISPNSLEQRSVTLTAAA
ncbi:hypothetical protein GCM10010421_37190 [Streptomyces glaucus]|uniref:Insertion element IS402-like domain-containing protein n=1 Tax=Streptomyces glaucus TaxID=284029 RepID=A0ABP5X1V5_9ACTN